MIFQLMRRDLSLRVSAPVVVLGLLAVVTSVKAPNLVLVAGLPYCFFVWSWMPRRGGAFDAALPIRGRELFAARYLSSLTLMLIPFIVAIVAGVISNERGFSAGVTLEYMAIAALATLVPYALRPGELNEPPLWLTIAFWIALAALSAAILRFLDPTVGFVLLAGSTILVGRELWLGLPDWLRLTGTKVSVDRQASSPLTRLRDVSTAMVPESWKPVLRSTFSPRFLIFYGVVFFSAGIGSWLLMLALATMSISSSTRYSMRWLSAIPLSNRARLLLSLVPTVFTLSVCTVAGRIIGPQFGVDRDLSFRAPMSSIGPSNYFNRSKVPLEYWSRSKGTVAPAIVAPWGESSAADTITVLGMTLFDPYTSGSDNSSRFVDWQVARATSAIYGYPMSVAQEKHGDHPEPLMDREPRMRILNAAAVLALMLLIVWSTEFGMWNRFGRIWKYFGAALLAIPVAAMFWVDHIYQNRRAELLVPIAKKLLWHASNALPANLVVVAIAAFLPVLAVYSLLEWQFAQSELAARRPKPQA
ncbi:MAG: hypothetical protein ABI446_12810 [Gemmatimonadaceae bacterium]